MDFDGGELLCRDVVCPGEWVLLTAMQRTEAGQLFALGGKPARTHISDTPWKIVVAQTKKQEQEHTAISELDTPMPEGAEEAIRKGLNFRYSHIAATQAPSKQTATGRKGRFKDEEVAEHTENRQIYHSWRQPTFRTGSIGGTEYGRDRKSVV